MADNERIWHLNTDGNQSYGPYTPGEIAQYIRTGRIEGTASIWREGWTNWQRVADVPDFGGMVPNVPVPNAPAPTMRTPTKGAATPPASAPATSAGTMCVTHPEVNAGWQCGQCGALLCDACVNTLKLQSASTTTCQKCGGPCSPTKQAAAAARGSSVPLLFKAFVYPISGSGLSMVIIGTIFFGILRMAGDFMGIFGWAAAGFGIAYMTTYTFRVIQVSASGRDGMPQWPNLLGSDKADIWWPLPVMLLIGLISYGPAIGVVIGAFAAKSIPLGLCAIPLFLLGILYFPMGILSAALWTKIYLKPHIVLRSVFRCFWTYLVAMLIQFIIGGINFGASILAAFSPLAGYFTGLLLSFYLALVWARVLGLIYFINSDRLGWQEHSYGRLP